MNPIEVLQQAKNIWNLAHTVGGGAMKNKAGGTYMAIQGAIGTTLMSVAAQKDT